jgi:hypothetical protein
MIALVAVCRATILIMKLATRAVIVVVLCGCVAGLVWIFTGDFSDMTAANAGVVSAFAGVMALAVSVVMVWPRTAGRRSAAADVTTEQTHAAVEYLAGDLRTGRTRPKLVI